MPKFRKKPVVIEVMQITEQSENEIRIWSNGEVYASPVLEPSEDNPKGCYWQIKTLEGVMTANPKDWIIKENYKCSKLIKMLDIITGG